MRKIKGRKLLRNRELFTKNEKNKKNTDLWKFSEHFAFP